MTTERDSDAILDDLSETLAEKLTELYYSTTVDFHLIPFNNNTIEYDGLTELITHHCNVLHSNTVTSVVNIEISLTVNYRKPDRMRL